MIEFLKAAVGGTPVEWGSLTATVLFLVLIARQNALGWPIGMLACVGYAWVFHGAKLYADMTLQVIFVGQLAYGWRTWTSRETGQSALSVQMLDGRGWAVLVAVWAFLGGVYGEVLHRLTDASFPRVDAALAAGSVLMQYLQARKYIENWPLWIAINLGYGAVYWAKDLRPTAFLMLLLVGLAVNGWLSWRRDLKR
jgi:nicotinamide mononucleotide transporter